MADLGRRSDVRRGGVTTFHLASVKGGPPPQGEENVAYDKGSSDGASLNSSADKTRGVGSSEDAGSVASRQSVGSGGGSDSEGERASRDSVGPSGIRDAKKSEISSQTEVRKAQGGRMKDLSEGKKQDEERRRRRSTE